MFASRWHSPPKPGSVLSCVTGTCRTRQPVGVHAALHVALEHARRARPSSSGSTRSSSVVLPAPGALMRFTTVTPARSKSCAVGRARSCCWRRARPRRPSPWCDACPPPRPRSTRPRTRRRRRTSHAGRRTSGQRKIGQVELPLAPARRAAQPRRDQLLLEPRALADRVARHESRSRTPASPAPPGAARPTRMRHDRHRAARRRASRPCSTIALDERELVHAQLRLVGGVAAQLLDRARPRARRRGRPRPRPRRTGRTPSPRRPPARRRSPRPCPASAPTVLHEAQHGLRVHAVRVDHLRRPRCPPSTSSSSGSIT